MEQISFFKNSIWLIFKEILLEITSFKNLWTRSLTFLTATSCRLYCTRTSVSRKTSAYWSAEPSSACSLWAPSSQPSSSTGLVAGDRWCGGLSAWDCRWWCSRFCSAFRVRSLVRVCSTLQHLQVWRSCSRICWYLGESGNVEQLRNLLTLIAELLWIAFLGYMCRRSCHYRPEPKVSRPKEALTRKSQYTDRSTRNCNRHKLELVVGKYLQDWLF